MLSLFSCFLSAAVDKVPVGIVSDRACSEASFAEVVHPRAPEAPTERRTKFDTELAIQPEKPKVVKSLMSIDEQDDNPSEALEETENLEELTSEGTCTVVLHPGDVLEYDPAEYFISEKDFQVKYECTINRQQTLEAKKSKTVFNFDGPGNDIDRQLEKARHVISGKKKEGLEYAQRKIHELPDAVGKHGDILIKRARESETVQKVLAAGGLRTEAGIECDLEKEEGSLPTLLRSQGVVSRKVKRTDTIDWQDVEEAFTYGYLMKHMRASQITHMMINSYGHLDDDMDKAVFIQYAVKGYPEAFLCLLVEDNAKRDTFVKSLNAHAKSAQKRKAEQAEHEKEKASKKKLERATAQSSAPIVTFSSRVSTQSAASSNPQQD